MFVQENKSNSQNSIFHIQKIINRKNKQKMEKSSIFLFDYSYTHNLFNNWAEINDTLNRPRFNIDI